jgi:hypothetical protein
MHDQTQPGALSYREPSGALPPDPRKSLGLAGVILALAGYLVSAPLAWLALHGEYMRSPAERNAALLALFLFALSIVFGLVGLAFLEGRKRNLLVSILLGLGGLLTHLYLCVSSLK